MRLVGLFLLVGLFNSAFSQDTFSNQLRKILADTPNYFSSFKGKFKTAQHFFDFKDSVFYSTIDLAGLRETEYNNGGGVNFRIQGLIADSVSEKNGKRILKDWKNKVKSALGKSFTVKKDDRRKPADHSWVFIKDDVEITISLDKMLGEPNYRFYYVYFSIEVFNQAEFSQSIKEAAKK